MSGGRATVQRRKGIKNRTQLGDITCVHEKGQWLTEYFYLECKFYKDLEITGSLINGRGKLATFWRETVKLAVDCERAPLLIAKQNRVDTLVIFSKTGLDKFRSFGYHPTVILTSINLFRAEHARVCFYREVFCK